MKSFSKINKIMNQSIGHITSACTGHFTACAFCVWTSHFYAKVTRCKMRGDAGVSFRKRRKRIKGGVVKVVNQGSQRTSRWLSTAKAG
jgi:hypothetical protein